MVGITYYLPPLSVTIVSPAKTAELIEMPFWVTDSGGPKQPCVRWGSRSPHGNGQFGGGSGGPL